MFASYILTLTALLRAVAAIDLTTGDVDSVCNAATLIVDGIMDYYEGFRPGGTIGMFQAPYYWWVAGEVFGGLIDTWYICQNDTWEDLIYDAMLYQRGDDNDYIPSNQSLTEGNDDQAFWGFAAMQAAERNFTNPSGEDEPGWLALAQAVYNTMNARWDTDSCDGGLRWQIFTWNSGYDYKNTISNAALFHMAARLARYTHNDTYAQRAEEVYDWLKDVGFAVLNGDSYSIYDGAKVTDNCSSLSTQQWTYNFGVMLAGAAYMYNYTEEDTWLSEVQYLLNGMNIFYKDDVLYERQCQTSKTCNNDQRSFRSITSRCLGLTARIVPSVQDDIMNLIDSTAAGAALSCSGGSDGHTCGQDWSAGSWDGVYGLGEQIAALEAIQNTAILARPGPYSGDNGGSSEGDADAGTDSQATSNVHQIKVTKSDKARAGVITAIVLAIVVALGVWMVL